MQCLQTGGFFKCVFSYCQAHHCGVFNHISCIHQVQCISFSHLHRFFLFLKYLFLLKGYSNSQVNRTGSPHGFLRDQILRKLITIQNICIIQTEHINIIRKSVPSVLLSIKMANKVRRYWYH